MDGKQECDYIVKDGVRYKKHGVCSKLFGYSFRDAWYPVAEDDPERFLYLTLFTGILGGHRFYAGEYGKGIAYLLTCGGFGIFYVSDVFNILTENYQITQVSYMENPDGSLSKRRLRIYLDRVGKGLAAKRFAFLLSACIGFCSMRFGYTRLLVWIDRGIEAMAEDIVAGSGYSGNLLEEDGSYDDDFYERTGGHAKDMSEEDNFRMNIEDWNGSLSDGDSGIREGGF